QRIRECKWRTSRPRRRRRAAASRRRASHERGREAPESNGGGTGSCIRSADVSIIREIARISGQTADGSHFRRLHPFPSILLCYPEVRLVFGAIVEAPGTRSRGGHRRSTRHPSKWRGLIISARHGPLLSLRRWTRRAVAPATRF